MSEQAQRFYEFDIFLLDAQERLLFRDGEPLDLTPKVFDILLELVQHRGRVVEKKELMEKVWPDSYVEESNLTQHISTLRKKLAHPSDRERYIMTVPGRGYRFLPSVREWDDDAVVTVHERIRARVLVEEEEEEEEENGSESRQLVKDQGAVTTIAEETKAEIIQTQPPRATLSLPAPATHKLKQHRALIPAILIALVVALAFGIYKIFISRPAPFEKTKLVKFTNTGKVTSAAISPDGKYVVYSVADAGRESLWIRQVATSNNGVQIVPPEEFYYTGLTFSPDGNYLYCLGAWGNAPGLLYRVPTLGGTPSKLVEDVDSPPTFSPDGKQLAYMRGYPDQKENALLIADSDGTNERKLASLKMWGDNAFIIDARPSWSPDGKRIACAINKVDDRGDHQELYEVQVDNGTMKPITSERWLQVGRAAWVADGSGLMLLATDQDSALSQVWYISYPGGEARKVTNDLDDYRDLSLTADSQTMAVVRSGQQANVWVVPEADASRAIEITSNNYDGVLGLAWTPDMRIVYSTVATGTTQNLWITDADGSHQKQLTDNVGFSRGVVVSSDGRYIVFVSTRDGKQHLWRMDADGSHVQRLTEGLRDNVPAVSPDSQWVVYRSYSLGKANLFRVPIGGGQPVRLTERGAGLPAISPDGKLIACGYREEGQSALKVALIPFEGGPPLKLLDLRDFPNPALMQWTIDGQALYYFNTKGGISNIWLLPIDGSGPVRLTNFDSQRIFRFAFSPDGHQLAVARGQVANDVVLIKANK